ncbi:class I lanthipeptide [Flavobacterium gelatinilyticum]|uniref:class I lanthipeptide n=1 Tax=Flavobacterium gelatinilyticum TaxID=3003260 RepID=UPI002480E40F|nr:class I lanthipeptide [Flavobacterium gelatinilyticum]
MKKLQLNKKTISVLDMKEMKTVNGGFTSIYSCIASDNDRACCRRAAAEELDH